MALAESADRVPVFDLNPEFVGPEERLAKWSEWTRPICDFAPLNWRGTDGILRARAWPTGKAVFTDTLIEPHVTKRETYHVRNYAKPTLVTRMHAFGHSSSEVRSDAYITKPGDLNVVDFTETYSSISTRVRFFTFVVSHEAVNYDPSVHAPHIRMPPDGPQGAALASAFLRIMKGLPVFTVKEAEAAVDHFLSLFARMLEQSLEETASPPDPTQKRQAAIRTFVENHLLSPDLTPGMLAAEFGISRATVYRDVEEMGGLQRYIIRRRLEEACKELAFGPDMRGIVGDVANRWHFSSTAHFSREFRRRFGFNPGKALNCALVQTPSEAAKDSPAASREEAPEWLERL
ncbi:MAG: helix-turn-helix domain-containing protein [Parvibaculum sp.]|uniref:helix-turn-helix domain-containing protein n=1 Tax=Parvibaculum sp. TaxID=2024848 RepID=UPI003265ACC1